MPRTALTIVDMPAFGAAVNDLKGSATAGDQSNNHDIVPGDILLLMFNDDSGGKTATLVSSAGQKTFNRLGDITLSPAANEVSAVRIPGTGFLQSDGKLHIDLADDTSVTFLPLRLIRTPV